MHEAQRLLVDLSQPGETHANTSAYASSDGLRIAYMEAGNGVPLLFLNGVGSRKEIWRAQLRPLSRIARCIVFDYRGYGESDLPPAASLALTARAAQSISRSSLARDAFAVMDACGVPSAHLCGCSLGGVVALECCAQAPERICSLTLVDSWAIYPHGLETIGERIRTLIELGMASFADSRAPGVLKPHAALGDLQRVRQQMASIPLAVYAAATQATWTGDYRALLPRIAKPTLVIWGENDTVVAPRVLSEELARTIPGAEFVIVPDAGHIPNVDNPRVFNAQLIAFLKKQTHLTT